MVDGGGTADGVAGDRRREFLVSHAREDQAWAEWIAWELETAGYRVLLPVWDAVPASNWVDVLHRAVGEVRCVIAVVSAAYDRSLLGRAEWQAAMAADLSGQARRLIPVRVEDVPLTGLLAPRVPVNLFGLDASAARERLVAAVHHALSGARAKPTSPPPLPPGAREPVGAVGFPGGAWLFGLPVVEPLSPPYLGVDRAQGPLAAMRALSRIVPFQPRDELDGLLQWCAGLPGTTSAPEIRIVSGVGGSGKTHLLAELTQRLAADGWYAGFLRDDLPQASLDWLATVEAPVAVAVDYAEAARTPAVLAAARALALRPTAPTCLLLGARTVSGWWSDDLRPALRRDGLPATAAHDPLPVHHPSPGRVYRRARAAFAAEAGSPDPGGDPPPPPMVGMWTTLDLVMLAWLRVHRAGALPASHAAVYEAVLDHEIGYWSRAYTRHFGDRVPTHTVLRAAGAAVTLLAPTPSRLGPALAHTPVLARADQLRDEVAETFTRVLPTDPADGTIAVRPDRVGDHLATTVYQSDPLRLVAQLTDADDAERRHACLTLTRAADTAEDPTVVEGLATRAVEEVSGLWRPALAVAALRGGPMLTALVRLAERPDTPLPLDQLASSLPLGHGTLRPLALAAATRQVADAQVPSATVQETTVATRAAALHTYAVRLAESGEPEKALAAARAAADQYRGLATANPARFIPDLAGALSTFAGELSETGDSRRAVAVAREAADLRRQLAQADPARFEPALAVTLHNLATFLSRTGDRGQALTAAREATELRRRLADADAAVLPDLATSLNNLASYLAETGDRAQALAVAREATAARRQLADADPAAFAPDLARSLDNLAQALRDAGDRTEAAATAQEAVALHRRLVTANPTAFLPNLASSLNNLANRLADIGEQAAALVVIREAVDLRRALAAATPAAFTADLATSLNNLAARLAATGDRDQAVTIGAEALTLYRRLAEDGPAAYLPNLATALTNLALYSADVGDRQQATALIREAVELRHRLAEADPAAFTPELAGAMNSLASLLAETGDWSQALDAATTAATLYRRLAEADPAAFLPDLATALTNLAASLSNTGDRRQAMNVAHEAVTLHRHLAATNPAAFVPDLASALNNLATFLAETGDRDQALTAAREATDLRRQLATTDPALYQPDLANALNTLANRLADAGHRDQALATAQEALALRRQLAATRPETALPGLATALHNLAIHLSDAGHHNQALAAAGEAVDLRRRLAATNRAAFRPDLAAALHTHAIELSNADDPAHALTTAREALELYRELAHASPAAFTPRLAQTLTTLATLTAAAADHDGALAFAREAVTLRRHLAEINPAAFRPGLAASLRTLADRLADTGDHTGALNAAREAVTTYRTLADTSPAAFLPALATAVSTLADQLTRAGRHDEALAAFHDDQVEALGPDGAGYLLAARASWRAGDDPPGTAADLAAAARYLHEADNGALATRARRTLRATALRLPTTTRHDLPDWAQLPVRDSTIDAVGTWADAETWDAHEAVLTRIVADLPDPTLRAELDVLARLFPDLPASGELAGILDDITNDGLDATLRRLRDDDEFRTLLLGWLTAPTWSESRDYIANHPELITDPRAGALLATAPGPKAAQHLAILTLLADRDLDDVFDLLTDPAAATADAMAAATAGDSELLASIAATAPYLVDLPFVGHFLAAIHALLTGNPTSANELAATAAADATDLQRRAASTRLHHLRKTHPELTTTINQLVDTLREG